MFDDVAKYLVTTASSLFFHLIVWLQIKTKRHAIHTDGLIYFNLTIKMKSFAYLSYNIIFQAEVSEMNSRTNVRGLYLVPLLNTSVWERT
jgi:hypothetical protein